MLAEEEEVPHQESGAGGSREKALHPWFPGNFLCFIVFPGKPLLSASFQAFPVNYISLQYPMVIFFFFFGQPKCLSLQMRQSVSFPVVKTDLVRLIASFFCLCFICSKRKGIEPFFSQ